MPKSMHVGSSDWKSINTMERKGTRGGAYALHSHTECMFQVCWVGHDESIWFRDLEEEMQSDL